MRVINAKIILNDETEKDYEKDSDKTVFQEFSLYYNLTEQREDFKLILEE